MLHFFFQDLRVGVVAVILSHTSLPQKAQHLIFSHYLEPVDLVNMEISGKYFKEHPGIRQAWKRFETKLSYQANQNISPFKNYNHFINDCKWKIKSSPRKNPRKNIQYILNLKTPPSLDQALLLTYSARYFQFLNLKSIIQCYPEEQIPPDVEELLEIKTVATQKQISELKFFIQARDTICFWQAIARAIMIDFHFDFSSCEQVIQQSKEFPNWIEQHLTLLNQITSLDLSKHALTSCPKEIGMLQSLTHLNLSDNLLTSLPKEIGELQDLSHLDLSWNELISLPKALLTLQHLQFLNLDGNYHVSPHFAWFVDRSAEETLNLVHTSFFTT